MDSPIKSEDDKRAQKPLFYITRFNLDEIVIYML